MAKAVLIMDMPESCCDCRFCRELHEGIEACCELADEPSDDSLCRSIDEYCYHRPDWCPLRELPEKMELCGVYNSEYYAKGGKMPSYKAGWNACIDAIT